jgi:hypothetical protein
MKIVTQFDLEQRIWFTGPETFGEFWPGIVRRIQIASRLNGSPHVSYDLFYTDVESGEFGLIKDRGEDYIAPAPEELAKKLIQQTREINVA